MLLRYLPNTLALTLNINSGIVNAVQQRIDSNSKPGALNARLRLLLRWFEPGLGIKRWFVLMVLGTALIGLGLAILILDIYRANPDSPWLVLLSLSALPRWLRAVIFGGIGLIALGFSAFRLSRTLLAPYVRPGKAVVDEVAKHRRLGRGHRVVAIGGGTGLSTLLRGLKFHTGNIVAIVSMADDGGSSGRLRRSLELPPPGDLRNCLAALSDDEDLLTRLFQYRFREGGELEGHSFGNLLIAALAGATGSFEQGVMEAGRVLAIRGRVLPATLSDVALVAEKAPMIDSKTVQIEGESTISEFPGKVQHLQLVPSDPPAYPQALNAILNADMVIVGPGSLYTSILPNLLVPDLISALRTARAFKVYVCNVATQPGETDGYNLPQHLSALEKHVGQDLFDMIVANDNFDGELPDEISWVRAPAQGYSTPVYTTDLSNNELPSHHDPAKLSETLIALLEERTGPLELPLVNQVNNVSGQN
jgi:uncharacterized cofD-like protein